MVDNDGGGIFSFLPQADLPEFELLFGTPHGLDLVAVARAHGVTAERIDDLGELPAALAAGDARVVVVPVDRAKSVERHRELWSAVAAAVGARGVVARGERARGASAASLAWVSAHSAPGSEPATMPAPA